MTDVKENTDVTANDVFEEAENEYIYGIREIGEDLAAYDYFMDVENHENEGDLQEFVDTFVPSEIPVPDKFKNSEYAKGYVESQLHENAILKAALAADEKELWFDWNSPKTVEEWKEWTAKYGDGDSIVQRWGFESRYLNEEPE